MTKDKLFLKLVIIFLIFILGTIAIIFSLDYTDMIKKWPMIMQLGSTISSLILVIITFFYFLETRTMAIETTRQRELLETPVVSMKILPSEKDPNLLYVVMKNSGGGAAYNISVEFDKKIPYSSGNLNDLNMFKNMYLLDKGEKTEFFFDTAIDYFNKENPRTFTATITYYLAPKTSDITNKKYNQPIKREFLIDIHEKENQLHVIDKDMNDLVKQIEDLKHVLLISLMERKSESDD